MGGDGNLAVESGIYNKTASAKRRSPVFEVSFRRGPIGLREREAILFGGKMISNVQISRPR